MGQYLFFLLILACPLMMIFMMRGHGHGHGHGGQMHARGADDPTAEPPSLEDLQQRRDELERQIAEHEELRGVSSGDRSPERV